VKADFVSHLVVLGAVYVPGFVLVFVPELRSADVSDFSQSAESPRLPVLGGRVSLKLVQPAFLQDQLVWRFVWITANGGRSVTGCKHFAAQRQPFFGSLTRVFIRDELFDDGMHF
jgi:hypothetical protein